MQQNYGTSRYYLQLVAVTIITALVFLFLMVSSIIWLPLLILNIPIIALTILLFKYTSIRDKYSYKIQDIFSGFISKSAKFKKFLWIFVYDSMQVFYPQSYWKIVNYGYGILNQEGKLLKNLKAEYEEERFGIQLYHYVATKFNKLKDLKGLNIVEISSGRGGGLEYINNSLSPNRCTGIDLAQNQINFCKKQYSKQSNMSFYHGDAEKLEQIPQLTENLYDQGLNIESLHCYNDINSFLTGASYIIKDQGSLIIADFKSPQQWVLFNETIKNHPNWALEQEEDITLNVSQALKLDDARRQDLMKNNINKFIQKLLQKFFSFEGGRIQKDLSERKMLYKAFLLKNVKQQKQE